LRDDIACGALFCPTCDKARAKLRESARNIIVIDTNVALHQVLISDNVSLLNVNPLTRLRY